MQATSPTQGFSVSGYVALVDGVLARNGFLLPAEGSKRKPMKTSAIVKAVEPVIDYLAEEELKAAQQMVKEVFDVRPGHKRACHSVISPKTRKAGKRERMEELVVGLKTMAAGAGR